MVMAAGLGTRLRPLTYDVPKPMVPVANRPVMEHLLRLLEGQGISEVIANLHWFPETITGHFGDGSDSGVELTYVREEQLLGTAGGVRNVAGFLTEPGEPFVVMAGDALTDVDLGGLLARHREAGGVATMAVKQVANVSEYGVVVTDGDGRVSGFQEKPDPAEALSDLCNTMIYAFEPEVFDYFPDMEAPDFAHDVFPSMLAADVPFHVHELGEDEYWNDVGSLGEYVQGNLDVVEGHVKVDAAGTSIRGEDDPADPAATGLADAALLEAAGMAASTSLNGSALIGDGVECGEGVRIDGPCVIGPGVTIGPGARIKESVLLEGATVPPGASLARAVLGAK